MPKHISRLIMLLVILGVLAYAAKQYFTVNSFYEFGHYRGNSVADMASNKPKFKGSASCKDCHKDVYKQWSEGIHYNPAAGKVVKCEVCHGPGGDRGTKGMFDHVSTGPDHPQNMKMIVPTDTVKLCVVCHEQIAGRPAQQKQIVIADHAGTQQCTVCHNPHSPLTINEAKPTPPIGNVTAGKADVDAAGCAACHGPTGISDGLPGPNLAGQNQPYIMAAFRAYKSGARSNDFMKDIVANVKDSDITDISAYFATQSCKSAHNGDADAEAAGQKLALASKCATCHGTNGISRQPVWPNLAGQSKDYLVSALQAYKNGGRKNGFMTKITKDLSDADFANLGAYFSNAKCQRDGAE